jgi:transketolase
MNEFIWSEIDDQAVVAARALAMDSVQKVGNGHPGTAMSLAPMAYLIFQKWLRHDPTDPTWQGRDRFVLSNGHSSITLYTQLFLSGYDLELSDLKCFRTWESSTPGHPEFGHTPGVEATTGPLGTGLATAVGMAMDARYVRNLLDPTAPSGSSLFDHKIWVIAGDGCLQEGVTSEASSLAGHQQLANLVVLYDDNHISIEGDTGVSFTEDVPARYRSYGWNVLHVDMNANGSIDVPSLDEAITNAVSQNEKPTLIRVRNIIGWPAPNLANTGKIHGSALGEAEVSATKEILGIDPNESFQISASLLAHTRKVSARGTAAHSQWNTQLATWSTANPAAAKIYQRLVARELPIDWHNCIPRFEPGAAIATRKASGDTINSIAKVLPEFWGGSADLGDSNLTTIEHGGSFLPADSAMPDANPGGRIIHYGIREFAMACAMNGMALGGLTRPFAGTFLVFSDFMRGAVRLSALMNIPATYVWTHDSIGLGEDGPTHQPVEHLWALRAIPNLHVIRPADANETATAWRLILEGNHPAGLCLSRQNLSVIDSAATSDVSKVGKGAYVLSDSSREVEVILIATGSEVSLALEAQTVLEQSGISTRVVSAPCLEWFENQSAEYRESVLPSSVSARVSIEAGIAQGWWKYVGFAGRCISLERFGASAGAEKLYKEFGITTEAIVVAVHEILN